MPDRRLSRLIEAVCDDTFDARIELFGEVGRGGMGTVYRGLRREDGVPVAIKELDPENAVDVDRFLKEAEVLEALDHPGIVRYYEHGALRDGRHYLAMQWLEGVSLSERLRDGPLSVASALAIARQVAHALAHAHARGVVHRDLKPANLMLLDGPEIRAILLDFGIARRTDCDDQTLTRTGQIVGTPGYFAPEQLTEGAVVDGRADVFALGCVLFEMLTGRKAFGARAVVSALVDVMTREPEPVDHAQAPKRVGALVRAMLAKAVERRPTAERVADELALLERALVAGDGAVLDLTSPLLPGDDAVTAPASVTPSPATPRALLGLGVLSLVAVGTWIGTRDASPSSSPASAAVATASLPICDRDRREGCLARCEEGEAEACLRHGEALSHGTHGYARDRTTGLTFLRRACDGGVGRGCVTGSTILRLEAKDEPVATWAGDFEALLVRGCELGLGNACRRLAAHLWEGEVVSKDAARATQVGERGCTLGDDVACRHLADWYGADEAKAKSALDRACRRHDTIACTALKKR